MTKEQLAALSKEEKLKLLDLIAEKKRRLRDRRESFVPNSGQAQVLRSKAQTVLVASGNGSGKTAMGANRAMWRAKGYDPINDDMVPVPRRVVVVLDHPDKVADKWLPELRKWFNIPEKDTHKHGKPYVNRISCDNGSEIKFMFHEQGDLVFESIEADDIIFDEPPPRSVYIALLRGMRNKNKKPTVWIIATPISGSWIREEIYDPWAQGELKDTECFQYGTEVNEANLPDGYIEWYGSKLTDKEKRIRLSGEFFDLEGLALKHLIRRETHIVDWEDIEWENTNPAVIVMDPHPSKAHHAIVLSVDRHGYLYVCEEYKEKALARQFAESLIAEGWFSKYCVIDILYDSLGNSEMTSGEGYRTFGEVINEVFKEHGIGHARGTTYDDKLDEDFVERIRDSLFIPETPNNFGHYLPKLRFLRHCTGTLHDVENVQWLQDKQFKENKPKLDIRKRDFLACLKYGLASNLYPNKKKEKAYYYKKPVYGFSARPRARMNYQGRRPR